MKVRWGSYWELDCIFTSQKRSLIFPYKLLHFRHDSYFARWSFHTWSLGCLWLRPTQVDPLINNVSNRVANENSPQCILDFETTGKCLVTISRELRCEHASLLVLRHKPLSNARRREICKGSGTNNVMQHPRKLSPIRFESSHGRRNARSAAFYLKRLLTRYGSSKNKDVKEHLMTTEKIRGVTDKLWK